MDYNPWGHKELDTTEQLSLSLFLAQLDLCSGASSLLTRVKWQPSERCLRIIMKIVLTLQIPRKFLKAPRGSVKKFDNSCTKYMLIMIIHAQKQGEAFTSRHTEGECYN